MTQTTTRTQTTTDHDTIREWAEERGGRPAVVIGTEILRFDFGEPEDNLQPIEWDAFFEMFEENNLALKYQEETSDGFTSRFFKFVTREK